MARLSRPTFLTGRRPTGRGGRGRLRVSALAAVGLVTAVLLGTAAPAAAAEVNPPTMYATSPAVTTSSISVRFLRSPAPDLVCKPEIGYEVMGGAFTDWRDVGGFPNAPCDDPDPGFKFTGLAQGTAYTLSIRAYRLTDGVKEYSTASSMTATTTGEATPPPTGTGTVAPASMYSTPTAVTTSSISVRFLRSPAPDLVCKPDIGYEVLGGAFTDWRDVGGFPNAPCDDPDPGYKFTQLTAGVTYTLSIRAYRLTGEGKEYSTASSISVLTKGVNPPTLSPLPSAVTTSSISVRFVRSASPDPVCKPDIGYEVLGGAFTDWSDVGGFPDAPCDDPDPGFKFSGLVPGTAYTLGIRAYRLTNGVKEYSTVSSIEASTSGTSPLTEPGAVAPPTLAPGPSAVTTSSISIRFVRSPAPDLVCKPDIGYEVLGGTFTDWRDVGGFPNAPCDDPDPGYKFSGLLPATTYTFGIRAYRITDGVKEYSTTTGLTWTTATSSTS
jgi:hypothetical protein